ncbi:MAG TPA: cell surface protein SprA [Bacteroidales bacterium]|nr:cell surface protein SprA [Bacteroidales bacterium]
MAGKIFKYLFFSGLIVSLISVIFPSNAEINDFMGGNAIPREDNIHLDDTIKEIKLPYPLPDENLNPTLNNDNSPLYGTNPSNLSTEIIYDPETNEYIFVKKLGDDVIETPFSVSFNEYLEYDFDKAMKSYWRQRSKSDISESRETLIPKLEVGGEIFDRIFGGNVIDIKPQGSAELSFGLDISRVDNPALPVSMQRVTTFDFNEKIQMNVVGQIGDKMKVNVQYDTEAAFDFENSVKLEYTGHEDEIIQKIEAGNVSLPLTGTLITGSQSLFGFKTEAKFGKLTVTTIFSQQKGESSTITVEGGAQTKEFIIKADQYEANKHFFLSHYFKENYDRALAGLPVINSGINITRIEVWVTNKTGNYTDSRNIVAFYDLGESNDNDIQSDYVRDANGQYVTVYPQNDINNLGQISENFPAIRDINQVSTTLLGIGMTGGTDYEKIESARLLQPSEYSVNLRLGYISLNSTLSADQVLAVAYEYTVGGYVFKVGEFSNSAITAPNALVLKLIKSTSFTPRLKAWDLMMKNIYNIGAYKLTSEDFIFDIMYNNDKTGTEINYLPAGAIDSIRLLEVLNLDNLNSQLDPYPDGMFDYVESYTVNSTNGRIIFPVREPFGSYLRGQITGGALSLNEVADQYVFQELYDSTQSTARQIAEKNKFKLKGKYKSASGSDISLNAINIPQGSVSVNSGAVKLTENVHYTVDYNLGRVKIIDAGILESGSPITISLESNSMFNIQTKTLIGSHFNYEFSKDFNVGATILHLNEKPLTQKVSIGDEPISNTIWGVNTSYRSEVPFLTKAVDFIPFIETKEMSTITVTGEFAQLIPGHSKAIDNNAYIDDFEGTTTSLDLKSQTAWTLASTPGDSIMFPESRLVNDLDYGKNRAKLAWYVVDSYFHRTTSPVSIEDQSSHYVREVYETELFPNRESTTGIPTNMVALNLAFYPNERGPYNYDVEGIEENGNLLNPKTRWGGVMRQLQTTDFEEANIEYIEFWMMDPFVEDSLNQGGDLYFNLGDVSEDILKDGRKSFEHGLPNPQNDHPTDTTNWGIIPLMQSLVGAFDNNPDSRIAQDVGLDGLNDEKERLFFSADGRNSYLDDIAALFGTESQAYIKAFDDPSSDNFHHYRGSDYDADEVNILERYKKFNGLEGNSPPAEYSGESYSTNGSTVPNVEDINGDNTLSESENYFQYRISIRQEDFIVGKNYITDKVVTSTNFANDEVSKVTWYQFKIPISDYDKRVGSISDFKSIRFIRMFMTNFSETTILRFATLSLVRGEWRKYNTSFMQPGEYIVDELSETPFDVSSVNIEENSSKIPVNYILPPGINRQTDPMNPQLRQLNEQAMSLKPCGLQDGDARAVFKNVNLDVRKYLRLKMFVHAESVPGEETVYDGDVSLFIRLGTDYKNNYYEYEIPLKITPPGNYDGDSDEEAPDRYIVWPEENNLDLDFELLQLVKQDRNDKMRAGDVNISLTRLYTMMDGDRKVSVMGNPNLSNVQTIMIGVRNPKKVSINDFDDGKPKCVEVWVNELRLTDFDEKGGWAANTRITTKLADFGSITVAGSTSKPGFGALNQKVGERQKSEINRYDISANFELGKFFPEKWNVKVPMYVSCSENVENPEYNPLDPDIPLKVSLSDPTLTEEYKDSIRNISQSYTMRKSLNFSNVKVNKTSGKPMIYDLANWSATYAYNEIYQRDVNTIFKTNKNYTGAVYYNYNATPKIVEPFKNVKLFNKKAFQIIKDFNFYYLPSQLAFRTNLNRQYGETQLRNVYNPSFALPVSVNKNFIWTRQYDFKYNLSKNLKFDFSATNNARIDEPQGRIYKEDPLYSEKRDSIMDNIRSFGRNTQYHHQWDVTYNLPINKIPLLNWVTANARYSGTYDWTAGPITADTLNLGNILQNGNAMSLNTQFNLLSLYNKVKYFDQINKKYRGRQTGKPKKKEIETVTFEQEISKLQEGKSKKINHKLKTEDVTIKATDADGKDVPGEIKIIDENRVEFTPTLAASGVKLVVTGKREKTESVAKIVFDNTLVLLMSVKNVSIGFTETNGTLLPGYLPSTYIMGMSNYVANPEMFGPSSAIRTPTIPFILGWQEDNFGEWAVNNNVVTRDTSSVEAFMGTQNRNWNIRASLEPIRDFRIDLTMTHSFSQNEKNYLRYGYNENTGINEFMRLNPVVTGNFSMSVITFGTAFEKFKNKGDYTSATFTQFDENRIIVANRLASQRPGYDPSDVDTYGFPSGYGKTSQDVLIPSFLAAYTNRSAEVVSLETFPSVLSALPNWRITYDGLGKIPKLKKYFRTVNLNHVYRSTFNIGSYQTRLSNEYYEENGFNIIRDELENYYSKYQINGISISEQFSPLISIDMTMINSFILKLEVKKTRNLNMSFSNNQLTELKTDEYIIGTGYRFKEVEIVVKSGGRQKNYKSDLNLRLDFSVRNTMTVIRKLEEGFNQPTAGNLTFTIKTSADYALSNRFNLRLFYDQVINRPTLGVTFPTSNTKFGVTLRFTLAT